MAGAAWLMLLLVRRLAPRGGPEKAAVQQLLLLAAAAVALPVAGRAQSAPAASRSTRAGVYTADQAATGQELYAMHCVSCHTAITHTGPQFAAKWDGRPFWELYSFVREEMPKSDPGSLTEREYITVLAYVLKMNGMPPGEVPLSTDSTELSRIRIEFKPGRDSSYLRLR
ncbi:MAG TPA: cytochrome c [Gemmatimonadales bacterium]|nr:cytochrome c [Gemmatimonadales bacterium]